VLWRKMVRDIWTGRGSYLACLVLIILGLMIYNSFSIASGNLRLSQEVFYEEQNFAHGFAEVISMPWRDAERLARTEGIVQTTGRMVRDIRVIQPEGEPAVYLQMVSLNLGEAERVNDARLLEGEELRAGEPEIWVDDQSFEAHQMSHGDRLEIIAGGRVRELTVVGVAISPEFTYPLRTEGELYPNPEQFGIAFISQEILWSFFPEMQGRVNSIVFTLEPETGFEALRSTLESELEQYGLITLFPRENQVSHIILSEEVAQLERMSSALPIMFLLIAALILYITLKRLVEQQRVQIGIMKAYGYTNREVIFHYLSYAFTLGIVGGAIGGLSGIYLAIPLTELLFAFFHVPEEVIGFSWYFMFLGLAVSLAIFLIAGYQGSRVVMDLSPAEAMRPPAPVSGKKTLLEKIPYFTRMLTIQGKMAIRNLGRNRGRTVFLFLGMTLSCAVVIVTWSLNDIVDELVFYQFDEVETYDARVTLAGPHPREHVQRELAGHPEVIWIEPLAEVPVTLTHQWRREDVLMLGIEKTSILYNIRDVDGRKLPPSDQGLILSERLAEKLQVTPGSLIELTSPYQRGGDDPVKIPVYMVIPQFIGMNAYLELTEVEKILGQGKFATTFMLNIDSTGGPVEGSELDPAEARIQKNISALRDLYQESEQVAAVDGMEEQIREVRELLETFGVVMYIYVLIGVVMAFTIIYSSSFIIISERSRELASMRVLGMTSNEVFSVITFEQWFISVFAIIAGLPLARALMSYLSAELSTDLYTLPSDLSQQALIMGAAITAGSIWIAQRFAFRKVRKLDLVEVLKTRE
jgi:putative ABC transport system permease protein